jgi:sRNA-binding protein
MSNMPHPFDPIAQLAEQFPAAFALAADARRPLAIGTPTNLYAGMKRRNVRRAPAWYCRTRGG